MADSNKNFSPALGDPFWLSMRPRARDTTVFGAVAKLSATEFLIAGDHSRSSLRKKMSKDFGILAV
jgi:hypothetical protein